MVHPSYSNITISPHSCLNCGGVVQSSLTCREKVNDLENDGESFDPKTSANTAEGKLELETAGHGNLTICYICLNSMRVS